MNFSTILKTSQYNTSDNLAFEYIVGKYFINEQTEYYPNFLLTYEIFKNTGPEYFDRENIVNSFQSLSNESITNLIKQSCINPMSITILNQYFRNCETLNEFMKKVLTSNDNDKLREVSRFWVPIMLYQIYFVLSELSKVFTHRDLHLSNVLVYKLPDGKYIKMNYINNEGKIITSFKTIYIPKIIDYGRCYFYKNKTMNSKFLYDTIVCKKDECNKTELNNEVCGRESGYYYSSKASFKNESHDLYFLIEMKNYYKNYYNYYRGIEGIDRPLPSEINYLLEDVFTFMRECLSDDDSNIYNVNSMRKNLEARILHTKEFKYDLDKHFNTVLGNYTCLGTLNIYEKRSRKMEFIPECD